MQYIEQTGIVIGHVDYRDSDRIVRLLTPDNGHISALARGARKSRKRFQGSLDMGNRVKIEVRPGRGELWSVKSALLDRALVTVRQDLLMLAQAAYACELVGALAQKGRPEPKLYGLLDTALLVLEASSGPPTPLFRMALEAKALTFAGVAPCLDRCSVCHEPLTDEPLVYDPSPGGVLHARCGAGVEVTARWAEAIEGARRARLSELVDSPAPAGPRWLFHDHLTWQLGGALKSMRLLADLEAAAG
jgi:DNA repair protein RecO (recombination protein O)